jgi:N,N-dimethylformamidase
VLKITGYPDRYSAEPGERIEFKVSLEEGNSFEARLVRVIHGDANPRGPGLKFRHIPSGADGHHSGFTQLIDAGSFMSVPDFPALDEPFTFFVMIWPTLTRRDDQTILTQWDAAAGTGLHIGLKAGGFVTVTTGAVRASNRQLRRKRWSSGNGTPSRLASIRGRAWLASTNRRLFVMR